MNRPASPPPTERHKHAVQALQAVFRLRPLEAARWIVDLTRSKGVARSTEPFQVLEARLIEPMRKGPAYVVPPPRTKKQEPVTPEGVIKKVITDSIEREALASEGDVSVRVVDFDFEEAARQTWAQGGCEIELLLRAQIGKRKPFHMLLGVPLPNEGDSGEENHWHMLEMSTWHMLAWREIVQKAVKGVGPNPCYEMIPLYLWPSTGLKDCQEDCSVFTSELKLPGILGDLMAATLDREKERARNRKSNVERAEYHEGLDRKRREAAALRQDRTGDAGITGEELSALVPKIDLDHDRITMTLRYSILRLWDEPADTLVRDLPPDLVGLSLFGYRPTATSAEDVLRQCAWSVKRAMRGKDALDLRRATAALAALAAAHMDESDVKRCLSAMKLRPG